MKCINKIINRSNQILPNTIPSKRENNSKPPTHDI